jgi:hypothetical protein
MEYTPRQKYLNIREASATYEVSRAKLHRLIRVGRLHTTSDPRDERATLVKIEELEAVFRFPKEKAVDAEGATYTTEGAGRETGPTGTLTSEMRARVDALRYRISGGRRLPQDSVDIIREWRERGSGVGGPDVASGDSPGYDGGGREA